MQWQIQALTGQLLAVTTGKKGPRPKPTAVATPTRTSTDESTKMATRTSRRELPGQIVELEWMAPGFK